MTKLKQYNIHLMVRGYQLRSFVITSTYMKAAEHFKVSTYYLKTYGSISEPDNNYDPYTVYCYPDSGELIRYDAENLRKIMRKEQWDQYITEYNKIKYSDFNGKYGMVKSKT